MVIWFGITPHYI